MPAWVPPTASDVPRVLPDTTGVEWLLMRHYSPLVRGRNVYILESGAVTEDHPGDDNADADSVRLTLFGAHEGQEVTDADAAILTAAGYRANLV